MEENKQNMRKRELPRKRTLEDNQRNSSQINRSRIEYS